jgi:hypothetical protein
VQLPDDEGQKAQGRGIASDRYKKKEAPPRAKESKRGRAAAEESLSADKKTGQVKAKAETAQERQPMGEDMLFRKPGRKIREDEAAGPEQAFESHAAEARYQQKASRRKVQEAEATGAEVDAHQYDVEEAEEWQPETVSSEEWQQYLKSEYSWMEENDAENEVELSVVFGGEADDDSDIEIEEDAASEPPARLYSYIEAEDEGTAEYEEAGAEEPEDSEESLWELVPEQEGEGYEQLERRCWSLLNRLATGRRALPTPLKKTP